MDNKISFKANLITNGIVNKNVAKAFAKETKSYPVDSFILTKGDAADGLQGYTIANLISGKAVDSTPTSFIFKNIAPDTNDEAITTKLVRGFKVLIEEAIMNQKKFWIEQEVNRASIIGDEQLKKSEITAKKGLKQISDAYKYLSESSYRKANRLNEKYIYVKDYIGKKMTEIAGDDKDVQALTKIILSE